MRLFIIPNNKTIKLLFRNNHFDNSKKLVTIFKKKHCLAHQNIFIFQYYNKCFYSKIKIKRVLLRLRLRVLSMLRVGE